MDSIFSSGIVVFDGAIGTELYERGFYINRPFEELNLSAARDVTSVHQAYVAAGAQVLTTNTFSCTRPQLKKFDIEEKQGDLIRAAIANARKATQGTQVKVGLSMGPLGVLIEPLGPEGRAEASEEFSLVAQEACRDGGHDLYILETFTNIDELEAAIVGIRKIDSIRPILASMSLKSTQESLVNDFARRIGSREDVQALGLNCSEGPSDVFSTLLKLRPLTSKPLIVQPNAGLPRHINGRYFYVTSPDYLAKYAKRYVEAGAMGVGGCCGTRPEHIAAVKSALSMMQAKSVQVVGQILAQHKNKVASKPWVERPASQVGCALREGKKIISIELLPPKGTDLEAFLANLRQVEKQGIEFVNVPDGARANTRVSSLHLASAIQHRKDIKLTILPHFTTRDRNLIALQSDLLGAAVNGVCDVLCVTGDPPKLGNNKEATGVYDIDSIGLSYLVDCLNRGVSPSGDDLGQGTEFGIGVAANPTAINMETELSRWKFKCESGADFAITQPIFDADSFFRWKELIKDHDRPQIVGIWPLISLRNAEFMANELPGVHVPQVVLDEMSKARDTEDAIKRGLDIARALIEKLKSHCEGFCISAPLGKVEVALHVLK